MTGVGLDVGGCEQRGIDVDVGGGLSRFGASRHVPGPADDHRNANASLVELALATAKWCVGGDLGFATIVAGEDDDRVLGQSMFLESLADHPDSRVDALEHCGQVRIVVTGPVVERIALVSGVLAQVALLAGAGAGGVFLAVTGDDVGATVENAVGGKVTQVEEEGPLPVVLDESHRLVIHPVHEVLGRAESRLGKIDPTDGLLAEDIGPEVGPVAHPLHLPGDIPGEPVVARSDLVFGTVMSVASQMPLSDHAGAVTVSAEHFRKRDVGGGQCVGGVWPEIIQDAQAGGVLSGQQGGPVWRADRGGGVSVGQSQAVSCQAVQVGCLVETVAVASQFGPAQVVGKNEDDIGRSGCGGGGRLGRRRPQQDHQECRQEVPPRSHVSSPSITEPGERGIGWPRRFWMCWSGRIPRQWNIVAPRSQGPTGYRTG